MCNVVPFKTWTTSTFLICGIFFFDLHLSIQSAVRSNSCVSCTLIYIQSCTNVMNIILFIHSCLWLYGEYFQYLFYYFVGKFMSYIEIFMLLFCVCSYIFCCFVSCGVSFKCILKCLNICRANVRKVKKKENNKNSVIILLLLLKGRQWYS